MLIECTIKRENGTFAEIGGVTYHFAPDAAGRHVATVENDEHIARFLSITEAYRWAKDATPVDPLDHDGDGRKGGSLPSPERDALAAEYEARFGKKPHHKMSAATIAEKLAEAE